MDNKEIKPEENTENKNQMRGMSLDKLSSSHLLALTMIFYFLSDVFSNTGELASSGIGTLGFLCLAIFIITFIRELVDGREHLL